MNCRKIETKLSAFQDKQLPEADMVEIENHLSVCSDCRQNFTEMEFTWKVLDKVERFESAPFFWTRVSQRLNEKKNKKLFFIPLRWFPVPAISTVMVIFAFAIGVYFGKTIFHQSTTIQQTSIEQEVNGFLTVNSLDEYTGESLTDAYVSLISENSQ